MMTAIAEMLAPFAGRIVFGAGIAALTAAGWVGVAVHYEDKGYAKALAAVAAKDRGAIDGVNKAKRQVDECYAGNRTWNSVDGVCE